LCVVRMALHGGGTENGGIEEDIHRSYAFKADSIRSSRTRAPHLAGSGLTDVTCADACRTRTRSGDIHPPA
jgi:hypothetical protein